MQTQLRLALALESAPLQRPDDPSRKRFALLSASSPIGMIATVSVNFGLALMIVALTIVAH